MKQHETTCFSFFSEIVQHFFMNHQSCRNLQEESHRDDEWVIPFHQTPTSCGNHVLFFVICATKSHKLGNNFSLSRYPGWKDVKWSYADLKPGDCHLVLSCFSVEFVAQIFGLWTVRDFCALRFVYSLPVAGEA